MRVFHFTTAPFALKSIQYQRLKVARIMELNDPFEFLCGDLSDKKARKAFAAFKEYESRRTGLLCFSRGWRNPLMWSHYGDRHKGAVLELEINDDLVERVCYESKRVLFDVPSILAGEGFTEEHARQIYATKAAHWRYEREVRVAVKLDDCVVDSGIHFDKLSKDMQVVGLILGTFCDTTSDQVRRVVPSGSTIRLRHARLAFCSFNVVRDKSFAEEVIDGTA